MGWVVDEEGAMWDSFREGEAIGGCVMGYLCW